MEESLALSPLQRAVSVFGSFFGALTQIAFTTICCLPVIECSIRARVVYALASQALYFGYVAGVAVGTGNFDYVVGEEGGPVGFLLGRSRSLPDRIMSDGLGKLAAAYPPQSFGETSEEENGNALRVIAARSFAARAKACYDACVAVLLGTAGNAWTTPAAVRTHLLCWAAGGCGLVIVGCKCGCQLRCTLPANSYHPD